MRSADGLSKAGSSAQTMTSRLHVSFLEKGNDSHSLRHSTASTLPRSIWKAMLVEDQIDFPKTHDITRLLELVAQTKPELSKSLSSATSLTIYAIEGRYPGDLPRLRPGEASRAFALAEEVMGAVRGALGR